MYKIQPTSRFNRLRNKLPADIRKQLQDTLRQLQKKPNHPSLRINYHYADWVYRKYGLEDKHTEAFLQQIKQKLAMWTCNS